jgi:hypothetical protein
MKRWLVLGGTLMLAAWLPYVYAELSNAPAEKKSRSTADAVVESPLEPATVEPERAAADTDLAGEGSDVATAIPPPPARPAPVIPAQPVIPPQPSFAPPEKSLVAAPEASEAAGAALPGEQAKTAEAERNAAPKAPPGAVGPVEILRKAYETQPRDALWADDAQTRIGAIFSTKDVPGEMLQGASCGRAVCRVQVRWTSAHAEAFIGLHERLGQEFEGDVSIHPLPPVEGEPDTHQVDLYLVRKGYTVSDLAN